MRQVVAQFWQAQISPKISQWLRPYFEAYLQAVLCPDLSGESSNQSSDQLELQPYFNAYLQAAIAQGQLDRQIQAVILNHYLVFGDPQRLHLAATCVVNNALFNLASGTVTVQDHVFFGHHVSLITGSHDYQKFATDRMQAFPSQGNDIVIEAGAWIGSNVTVLGPCQIGQHAVIAAGAVVRGDIAPYVMAAGVPAKPIKSLAPPSN
jgi:acetyltransferase-like isoleucine patch superfamily enzyme